jgi:hypothetical protein
MLRVVLARKLLRSFSTNSVNSNLSILLEKHGASLADKLQTGEVKLTPAELAASTKKFIEYKQYSTILELLEHIQPHHSHYSAGIATSSALAHAGLKQYRNVLLTTIIIYFVETNFLVVE